MGQREGISRGDPLLLPAKRLDEIMDRLTAIRHLDRVRNRGRRIQIISPRWRSW
jgi:L-lysine 2,3-aminomutase